MKRPVIAFVSLILAVALCVPAARAQQKLAQTGFGFLTVGTDARSTGMGEAFTTMEGTSTSLMYNPAGIASLNSFVDLSANNLRWIADIRYLSGTLAIAPFGKEYGVIGISVLNVDYGEFKFTRVAANEQGYVDVKSSQPLAYVLGVGYGKELSNQFAVGGQIKYAYQKLGQTYVPVYRTVVDTSGQTRKDTSLAIKKYREGVIAFDFGTIYKTGFKSLAFGVSINNFAREIRYERENFQLPLSFKIGVSMNVVDFLPEMAEMHSLLVSIDAVHPRSYAEYLNMGGEYVFANTVAIRFGYITHHPDYGFTAGIGVRKFGLAIDYSYMPHKIFNDVSRISVKYSM